MNQISKTRSLSSDLNRRSFIAGSLLSVALPLFATKVKAATTAQAEKLIFEVVGIVQNIINSGKSEGSMIQSFEGVFRKYGHVQTISRSVLGPAWKSASAGDQKAYVEALQGYLARKYGKHFRSFIGASIDVVGSKDFGRKGIIVETVVKSPSFAPTTVEWHVVEAGGQLRFFDMYIEGVKLISTERSEIRALLDRNGGSVGQLAQALTAMG